MTIQVALVNDRILIDVQHWERVERASGEPSGTSARLVQCLLDSLEQQNGSLDSLVARASTKIFARLTRIKIKARSHSLDSLVSARKRIEIYVHKAQMKIFRERTIIKYSNNNNNRRNLNMAVI